MFEHLHAGWSGALHGEARPMATSPFAERALHYIVRTLMDETRRPRLVIRQAALYLCVYLDLELGDHIRLWTSRCSVFYLLSVFFSTRHNLTA